MAFVILALLVLLVAAVTYGVFFLIFKLIWVIAGKSRNKWPLLLAGAATVLLFLAVIASIWMGVNTYVKPLMGLANKVQNNTQIVSGNHPYKDAKYGFTMNLFGGTEVSDWAGKDSGFLLGIDTNAGPMGKALQAANRADEGPFSVFGVVSWKAKKAPQEEIDELLETLQINQNAQFKLTHGPELVAENTVYLAGIGTSNTGRSAPVYMTVASQQGRNFLVVGMAFGPEAYAQQLQQEVRSFRLPGVPPAPVEIPYILPLELGQSLSPAN